MTEFPHVSPVVLRFLEWMGPQVALRRRRAPTRAAVAEVPAVERPAAEAAVEPPFAGGRREAGHPAAVVETPAPVSRLLEAAARRSARREAALQLAPTPTRAPTQSPVQAPALVPAPAPGPTAAYPAAPEHRVPPTGWFTQAEYRAPWTMPQLPLTQYPAGSSPWPAPDQARPGPSFPGTQQQPLFAPGPLAWEQAAAAWAGPGPALQAGLAPLPIAPGFDRALRPPVAQDEAPEAAAKALAPGFQPQGPGGRSAPVQGAQPPVPGGQSPAPGARGGVRLLEEARLRQMLAEILRADALRHGLDLKER